MHSVLMHNWRYFFRSSVLDSLKSGVGGGGGGDELDNSEQFVAILQVSWLGHGKS